MSYAERWVCLFLMNLVGIDKLQCLKGTCLGEHQTHSRDKRQHTDFYPLCLDPSVVYECMHPGNRLFNQKHLLQNSCGLASSSDYRKTALPCGHSPRLGLGTLGRYPWPHYCYLRQVALHRSASVFPSVKRDNDADLMGKRL